MFDMEKIIENLENRSNLVSGKTGGGKSKYYIELLFTDEMKKRTGRMLCNNYRKMHGVPLIRKGSVVYRIKHTTYIFEN